MASSTARMQSVIPLIPPGKVRCFITGKLRGDTPEENVRQRWARSLVDEYGYAKLDIGIEVSVKMGRARKACDIVVYRPHAEHLQENIAIVIEVKRDDVKPSDGKEGIEQLKSYMAACSACGFGLWVGKERRAFVKSKSDGLLNLVSDIPRFGEDKVRKPQRSDLKVVHELTSVFKRCHNYIHANSGLQKAEAFHEMLKLIFCKNYEEQEGGDNLEFSIDPTEQRSEAGQRRLLEERLTPLFDRVKSIYVHIFKSEEKLLLPPDVAAYVVGELQFISILNSATDVKGEAYETLVGANLRGDRGEYFTPRNVCDMTVRLIMSLFDRSKLTDLRVADCCCGTGGFLVSWLSNLRFEIQSQEENRGTPDPESRVRFRVSQACARCLYGLDINPSLVRTAQMNLVMHGDGSTNVFRASTVKKPGEWPQETRDGVPYGSFDVVITNPPFGNEVMIDDAHVLSQYELPMWQAVHQRSSMPAEQLFIEAAMNFLKPGGVLGVVLPDGILNNPGLSFLRDWITKRARIIASIALPKETFGRNGGVNNPSVLLVRKFSLRELRDQMQNNIIDIGYKIFMCAPQTAGIDKRGNAVFLRHPNGEYLLDKNDIRVPDDQISHVSDIFKEWLSKNGSPI